MTAEKKNRYGLMRSFAVLCVIMGTYFSFATAVSAFVLIDVFTLAGVLLVIWGASAAFEMLVPSMPAKTRRYVTYGVLILLCIMIGYCGIDVIQGTGGFVQMFKDHVSDRQVMMPSHDPSATFIGFAAISSAAVALLGTRRNTLPLVVLITFPVVEVCLYFALVPLHSAFAALMIGYAALGAMDLIPGEDRGRTSDARSQSAFAASVLMCAAIVAGSLYTAIVGRSKAADQFRESFLNYVADFSVQKFTEDVKQALLPSRDHSLTHDGQLGTVDKVEFKGTSMLEVTVPSDIDGLYLKGFTGESYTGTRWSEAEPPPELATDITSAEFFPGRMLKYVPGYTELPAEYIVVRNTDAAPNDRYFPQNAAGLIETDGTRRKYWAYLPRDKGWSMDLIADAPLDLAGLPPEMYADEQMLRTGAYDNYLTIPASFTAHRDFFDGTEGDTTAQILKYIHDKLSRDCEYDLEAGRLPFGRDLAQWFLTENKKGSCTHFASAAVLLCRSKGIPARYCEGFIIKPEDVSHGIKSSGYSTVTVPDNRCHAWAEIYLDGFGWVVFETTPGYGNFMFSTDEDGEEVPVELTEVTTSAPEHPESLFAEEDGDGDEDDGGDEGEGSEEGSDDIMGTAETSVTDEDSAEQTTVPETVTETAVPETTRSESDPDDDEGKRDLSKILDIIAVIAAIAAVVFLIWAVRRRIWSSRRELTDTDPARAVIRIYHMLLRTAAREGIDAGNADEKGIATLAERFGAEAAIVAGTAVKARFSRGISPEEARMSASAYKTVMTAYLADKRLMRIVYKAIFMDRYIR